MNDRTFATAEANESQADAVQAATDDSWEVTIERDSNRPWIEDILSRTGPPNKGGLTSKRVLTDLYTAWLGYESVAELLVTDGACRYEASTDEACTYRAPFDSGNLRCALRVLQYELNSQIEQLQQDEFWLNLRDELLSWQPAQKQATR